MNNKLLVEVLIPATCQTFDVFIPKSIRMGEVIALASAVINELCVGRYKATDSTLLFNADTGEAYDVNSFVYELDIKNGSRLMLV